MATSKTYNVGPITVTQENFNRAESDMYFAQTVKLAGGIGNWQHNQDVRSITRP